MYIRKLKSGKWYVEINKKGFPRLQKSFLDKPTARNWAREIELQMDKNIFEDYSGAAGTTLKALLLNNKPKITIAIAFLMIHDTSELTMSLCKYKV
jgi:hypothetical protein